MTTITIVPLASLATEAVAPLLLASRMEGFRLVERLVDEYASGANRFDQVGEVLLGTFADGQLVGIGGVNRDPYAHDAGIGRLRHLYVLPEQRQRGVGRQLVAALVAQAAPNFALLRLRTTNPVAARFYERLGFAVVVGDDEATHTLALAASSLAGG